ncbi:SDR family NAD(P)-dependent oxidoreductase [Kaistia dalseonensis]|uniref:NAD(P)-dependent dehydrogenase (Short-subunit alcohol dehydrogenase family) n=1 Tax=Kaistia dalseonensis TaxID=410840 RepID=A0ABU0H1T8_9HYPH|nr:SDR family NAD(P)-dependent oxidoreductase [Kaistia dalseonensis]MCX5493175.1 SDR family NAD(P)-dependent oxidoreductase [Kaistia dalseonensis]MDQ0435730.1 NAD(P)-dependent dehydrogenase (short-subunit alcohol dehydrogenase family) [Kaistia dalseonensis]
MASPDLSGRIIVVTGASRGIGWNAAVALGAAGAHVIAIARTVGALEELDDAIRAKGGSATLVPLDLRDLDAIDRLGLSIYERWGKLDGLLGNAGLLGLITPVGHLDPKEWNDVMTVNVTANYRLIRSLDPLLQRSDAGRALFLSSGAAEKCRPFWGAYSTSKAALEALVRTYAAEVASTSVRVNLFEPGPLRTQMRAKARPGEDPQTLKHPSAVAPDLVRMLSPEFHDHGTRFEFPTNSVTHFLD